MTCEPRNLLESIEDGVAAIIRGGAKGLGQNQLGASGSVKAPDFVPEFADPLLNVGTLQLEGGVNGTPAYVQSGIIPCDAKGTNGFHADVPCECRHL